MENNMIMHEAMNEKELFLMPVDYTESTVHHPFLYMDDEDEEEEDIEEDENFDDMDDDFDDDFEDEDDDYEDEDEEFEDEEDDFDYEEDVDYDDFDE